MDGLGWVGKRNMGAAPDGFRLGWAWADWVYQTRAILIRTGQPNGNASPSLGFD